MINIAEPVSNFQFCIMCKSNCSGSCISLLKVNHINSDDELTEVINLLNNIKVCDGSGETNKNLFMTEIISLKAEARQLLDEVNHSGMRSSDGKLISGKSYGFQELFEDNSFKEKLDNLRRRIQVLSAQTLLAK